MKIHKSSAYENSQKSAKNDQLHPKNPYFHNSIDFFSLRKQYWSELEPFITIKDHFRKKAYFNWRDPSAVRALTKVLLQKDFGIILPQAIPDHYLCPPLPNRLNYLCWIDDLTQSTSSLTDDIVDKFCAKRPLIIDIGTGVLGIYAILGTTVFRFRFIASDILSSPLDFLNSIRSANSYISEDISTVLVPECAVLQETIKHTLANNQRSFDMNSIAMHSSDSNSWGPIRQLFHHSGQERLQYRLLDANHRLKECNSARGREGHDADESRVPMKKKRAESADEDVGATDISPLNVVAKYKTLVSAVMTNPPFYDIDENIQENEETYCSGNIAEMRTVGGEVTFIAAMIIDSLVLRESVLWYTAMVGKKSSLKTLYQLLESHGIPREQTFTQTFSQGVTTRWALAWTFSPEAAALYQTYSLLNVTKASDSQPTVLSAADTVTSGVSSNNHGSSNPDASAVNNSASISILAKDFIHTMLSAETSAPYPSTTTNMSMVDPQSAATFTADTLAARYLQRVTLCLDQLAHILSQQHFQGFESMSFMSPLGHITHVKWNVRATYEILPLNPQQPSLSLSAVLQNYYDIRCRLSFLTSEPGAVDSLTMQAHKAEALKPLMDLRMCISLQQAAVMADNAAMDTEETTTSDVHGTNDNNNSDPSLLLPLDTKVLLSLQMEQSYCAAALASQLLHRTRDIFEGEILRVNRRWRRILQREKETSQTQNSFFIDKSSA